MAAPQGNAGESRKAMAALTELRRRLEHDAYNAVVAALFADGELSWRKSELMLELRHLLHVSDELHRAAFLNCVNSPPLCALAAAVNPNHANNSLPKRYDASGPAASPSPPVDRNQVQQALHAAAAASSAAAKSWRAAPVVPTSRSGYMASQTLLGDDENPNSDTGSEDERADTQGVRVARMPLRARETPGAAAAAQAGGGADDALAAGDAITPVRAAGGGRARRGSAGSRAAASSAQDGGDDATLNGGSAPPRQRKRRQRRSSDDEFGDPDASPRAGTRRVGPRRPMGAARAVPEELLPPAARRGNAPPVATAALPSSTRTMSADELRRERERIEQELRALADDDLEAGSDERGLGLGADMDDSHDAASHSLM